MDPEEREQIIREHGPYVSTKRMPARRLNTVNIKHIIPQRRSPTRVHFKGAPSLEDSGPPSPTAGPIQNFGEIAPKIYRSSFPYASNLGHLQSLGLKTMITLVKTQFDIQVTQYLKEANIKHYRILIPAHKNGNVIAMEDIAQVLRIVTNPLNHPVLIHCNKGKYLTEYHEFARDKSRTLDEAFIRGFSAKELLAAIEAIERGKTAVSPIDYSVDLPTPPMSKCSSEFSPIFSREVSPAETFDDDEIHGPVCQCAQDGTCPFQLEHEKAAMAELLGPVSRVA
ncbi:MAG: hypothetical protein Q9163_006156 [Psora crenata]